MSEQLKQVLELFTQPAFFVHDGAVLWCNTAAHSLVCEGTPIASLLDGDETILSLWNKEGTAQISLCMQGEHFDASVRVYEDMLLFVTAIKTVELSSSASTAMNLSCSMRKPLHAMMNAAGALFECMETEESKDAASELNRAIYQMMRLCNQMADGSRLLLGQMQVQKSPTDLMGFFDHFVQQIRPLMETTGRVLTYHPLEQSLRADVDVQLLERALFNLIANALSYTPKGGNIILQLQKRAKRLFITVSDDGEGIGTDVIGNLFERYGERRPGDSRWGSGYGISMVREIARLHGGTMMVSANENHVGTRVVFTLSLEPTKLKLQSPKLYYDYCSGLNHALVELSDVLGTELYDPADV